MLSTKTVEKMAKVFSLFTNSASTDGEKASAKARLLEACKANKCKLADFVGKSSYEVNEDYSDLTYTETVFDEAKADFAEDFAKQGKKQSRRSIILDCAKKCNMTRKAVLDLLASSGYPDRKANSKAVSGTLYDILTNKAPKRCHEDDNGVLILIY